jgi:uncharacterized membrane protein (UPF0127 family)
MVEVYRDGLKICNAKEASNFFERALGLMFRGRLEKGEGLLIEFSPVIKSRSIHSFFMRFTIDLIFIDSNITVVDLHTLAPWGTYNPKVDCKWVLELGEGAIKENDIKIGDALTFE